MSKPNKLVVEGHVYFVDAEIQGRWLVIADRAPTHKYIDYDYIDDRFDDAFDVDYTVWQPGAYLGKLKIVAERVK